MIKYVTIGILTTALTTVAFAWWTDASNQLLLSHYGFDMDGMNEKEFYERVSPENMDRVRGLQRSVMGIGWPLKAIMTYVFYIPYLLILYPMTNSFKTKEKRSNSVLMNR